MTTLNRWMLIGVVVGLMVVSACGTDAELSADAGLADDSGGGDAMQATGDPGTVTVREEDGFRVVTFTTSEFVVAPNEERYVCQNFANPLGEDVAIVKSRSVMAEGSHHMFAFQQATRPTGIGALEVCSGLEFGSTAHSSQVPERTVEYPEGIARAWAGTDGIRIQAHYLNVTSAPITARVEVTLYTDTPSGYTLSGSIFYNTIAISVDPNSPGSAERTCTLPQDIHLMNAISHMHRYGVRFVATTGDGTVIYETTEWSEPETQQFDPPLMLPAGTQITYRCEYVNTTNQRLTFGESAQTNEMCIFGGQFYPAPNGGIVCL